MGNSADKEFLPDWFVWDQREATSGAKAFPSRKFKNDLTQGYWAKLLNTN